MTQDHKEIKDHRNADDWGEYKYYKVNGKLARLVFNKDGDDVSADGFDPETGELYRALGFMNQIMKDPHVDEITEEEFYEMCHDLFRKID